jgi:hypothetical protein
MHTLVYVKIQLLSTANRLGFFSAVPAIPVLAGHRVSARPAPRSAFPLPLIEHKTQAKFISSKIPYGYCDYLR